MTRKFEEDDRLFRNSFNFNQHFLIERKMLLQPLNVTLDYNEIKIIQRQYNALSNEKKLEYQSKPVFSNKLIPVELVSPPFCNNYIYVRSIFITNNGNVVLEDKYGAKVELDSDSRQVEKMFIGTFWKVVLNEGAVGYGSSEMCRLRNGRFSISPITEEEFSTNSTVFPNGREVVETNAPDEHQKPTTIVDEKKAKSKHHCNKRKHHSHRQSSPLKIIMIPFPQQGSGLFPGFPFPQQGNGLSKHSRKPSHSSSSSSASSSSSSSCSSSSSSSSSSSYSSSSSSSSSDSE